MKTVKIFAAWMLLAALLIPSLGLTSCSTPPTGPGEEGSQSAEGSVTSEQTQETETGRGSIADNLPDGLTFSGETVCVLTEAETRIQDGSFWWMKVPRTWSPRRCMSATRR